jgi:hypothetical protein
MQRARMFSLAAVLLIAAAGAYAQPTYVTIPSSPLQLNVASDGSMQIFNNAVPGTGQIYPSSSQFGDFGVFARIDGTLYAPNFAAHGTTATTTGLGTYTPWTTNAISAVTGDGSPATPYAVAISLRAPGTDVFVNILVTHVRGNNFFRLRTQFTAATQHEVDVFVGADIYLAGSDNGIFVSVPELNAVGGRNCDPEEGAYNILLIPITPADRFTTGFYSDVWSQIGAGDLNSTSTEAGCIDNGAAVQWQNVFADSTAVELRTAVSFGDVPSAANFHGFFIDVTPDHVTLLPGESVRLTVRTEHNEELGFDAPITLSAPNLPPGMTIVFDDPNIAAPGDGTRTATLTLDGSVFPQFYNSIGIFGSGGNETRGGFFSVDVLCTPPFILGLPTSQPASQSVARGSRARLTVKPEGGGAFSYQWYAGHAPLVGNPIPGANSATFETPAVTGMQQYWVRVSNPCGSTNSLTATVTPSN